MTVIKEFVNKINDILKTYMEPFISKLVQFFSSEQYIIFAVIGLFLVIIILIGLIRWLRKSFKSFIFFVILFGLIVGAWLIAK